MINPDFAILGGFLVFLGDLGYLIDTIKGRVKPNKVSWLLWFVAPFIAFLAEISQGVGVASFLTVGVFSLPFFIFLASFLNKESQWQLGKLDFICGALSLMALLLWYLTKVGNIAIIFSILTDALAAIPTIVKSYKAPETESSFVYLMNSAGAGVTLLSLESWNFQNYGFPLYILLVCTLLFALIKFKPRYSFSIAK